jgi:hypothetical protein
MRNLVCRLIALSCCMAIIVTAACVPVFAQSGGNPLTNKCDCTVNATYNVDICIAGTTYNVNVKFSESNYTAPFPVAIVLPRWARTVNLYRRRFALPAFIQLDRHNSTPLVRCTAISRTLVASFPRHMGSLFLTEVLTVGNWLCRSVRKNN